MKRTEKSNFRAAVLLALVGALLMTAGCSSKGGEKTQNEWNGVGGCYTKEALPGMTDVIQIATYGEDIYVITADAKLCKYDNGECRPLFSVKNSDLISFDVDDSGIWLIEQRPVDAEGTFSLEYYLHCLSFDGNEELSINIGETSYAQKLGQPCQVISNNGAYIRFDSGIIVLDENGEYIRTEDFGSDSAMLEAKKGDGVCCMLLPEGGGCELRDITADTTSDAYNVGQDCGAIFCSLNSNSLLFTDDYGLYEYSEENKSVSTVIIWAECKITFTMIYDIRPLPEGKYICLDSGDVFLLKPADPSSLKEKTTISIALLSQNTDINSYISSFNQQSDEYYVEVIDYYTQTGSVDTAVNLLNTQLISGGGTDIIQFSGVSAKQYGQRGFLLNLYDFMDSDEDIAKGDFLCLGCFETDGKLCAISPGFFINTFLGLKSVFGEKTGWTFDEYFDMEKNLSDGNVMIYNSNKEEFLRSCLMNYMDSAIDWGNGTCDFDNPDFVAILKATNAVKEADETDDLNNLGISNESLIASGENKIMYLRLTGIYELASREKAVGQELCFIGWPTADGSCGSSMSPMPRLGINANSKNAEGAWEFIKYVISDSELQEEISATAFPIYKKTLDQQIEVLLHPFAEFKDAEIIIDDNGGFYADGVYYDIPYDTTPLIDEKQVGKITSLLNSVTKTSESDQSVYDIVYEECQRLFAGNITAGETAKNIQSRVTLYVAEQK